MPFYNDLRPEDDLKKRDYLLIFPGMPKEEKIRTIENLLLLRQGLSKDIPAKKADENLLVASWNIREFGHLKNRLYESYFYIAEILARFDLVAIQEVKTGLRDLYIIMSLLGSDWSYIINDITEGKEGNSERSAYIFNNKRVRFAGLAGEVVLWDDLTRDSQLVIQLKRTPYMTGFTAGWKTFSIISLHLHPGDDADDVHLRGEEVRLLLKALEQKISQGRLWNDNLILTGDFNLYKKKDGDTIQLIEEAGYREVEGLAGKDTNASKTEAYDRLFLTRNEYFVLAEDEQGVESGGVFDPFEYVFKTGQEQTYKAFMKAQYTGTAKDLDQPDDLRSYYLHPWRKNQLSDHFPIWCELIIDSSDTFLADKLKGHG